MLRRGRAIIIIIIHLFLLRDELMVHLVAGHMAAVHIPADEGRAADIIGFGSVVARAYEARRAEDLQHDARLSEVLEAHALQSRHRHLRA